MHTPGKRRHRLMTLLIPRMEIISCRKPGGYCQARHTSITLIHPDQNDDDDDDDDHDDIQPHCHLRLCASLLLSDDAGCLVTWLSRCGNLQNRPRPQDERYGMTSYARLASVLTCNT
ncbi:hypothetical protein WAI453_011384 [Rhynchosporium graminicola]